MPTQDDYGQGVDIAALTDAPDASTLAKSIANAIVQRSGMRFTSASHRNAVLSKPVFGMLAALAAERLLTFYDGAAWVVVAAGTSAWTTPALATGYTHNGNSNGTVQYRIVNLFGEQTVMWRGGLNLTYSGSNLANGGYMLSSSLPSAARPTTLRTVSGACSAASSTVLSLKIDAETGGNIRIVGTGPGDTPPWLSFNNVMYSL
ncbi:hypothetical protein [Streptomyces celluloflavus]|uniref:Minor tail protein n=1 Tax=Streptomyces celluloflavus TaxID=58344 RepID=A0ABW7RKB1_9ACTN|nr:hypothetical protein OG717_33470 [Streptomyces celluloflavus]